MSKSTQGGQPLAIPNFAFLITDMPAWSKKPRTATVIYFDYVIFNDDCLNGKPLINFNQPNTNCNPQQANARGFGYTPQHAPEQIHFVQPLTTEPTTTKKPPQKALSLMELLGQRKNLMTTEFTPTPKPVVPNDRYIEKVTTTADICANQIFGTMTIGNSWYDEGSDVSGITASIQLQADAQPGANFEINVQFAVPVQTIEVWKFLAIPTHDSSLWQFKQKTGYSYDANLDFTINALSPVKDPSKITGVIVYCGGEVESHLDAMATTVIKQPDTNNDKDRLNSLQGSFGQGLFNHKNRLTR